MAKLRKRTGADLVALFLAMNDLLAHLRKQREFCSVVACTLIANPTHPDAFTFGLSATETLEQTREAAFSKFEKAAVRLLGVGRRPDESAYDYAHRVVDIVDGGDEGMAAAMRANGLVLVLD